jgi:hypothetical protein
VSFKDRFSGHAADYARYRPQYPPELFIEHWLAQAWGDVAQSRAVRWPIHLRVGRS